jgi:hypothetical protein
VIFQRELRRILVDTHLASEERRRAITRLVGDLIGPDRAPALPYAPEAARVRGYNEAKEEARERLYR